MADWTNPKLNWIGQDPLADIDLNRIEENTQYLYENIQPAIDQAEAAEQLAQQILEDITIALNNRLLYKSSSIASGDTWNVELVEDTAEDTIVVVFKVNDSNVVNQTITIDGSTQIPVYLTVGEQLSAGIINGTEEKPVVVMVAIIKSLSTAYLLAGSTRDYAGINNKPTINGKELAVNNTTASLDITAANTPFSSPDFPGDNTIQEALETLSEEEFKQVGDMVFTANVNPPSENYIPADGQEISSSSYPDLYNVLAGQYGTVSGGYGYVVRRPAIPSNIPAGQQPMLVDINTRPYSANRRWAVINEGNSARAPQIARYNFDTNQIEYFFPALRVQDAAIADDGAMVALLNSGSTISTARILFYSNVFNTSPIDITNRFNLSTANNTDAVNGIEIAKFPTGYVVLKLMYSGSPYTGLISATGSVNGSSWSNAVTYTMGYNSGTYHRWFDHNGQFGLAVGLDYDTVNYTATYSTVRITLNASGVPVIGSRVALTSALPYNYTGASNQFEAGSSTVRCYNNFWYYYICWWYGTTSSQQRTEGRMAFSLNGTSWTTQFKPTFRTGEDYDLKNRNITCYDIAEYNGTAYVGFLATGTGPGIITYRVNKSTLAYNQVDGVKPISMGSGTIFTPQMVIDQTTRLPIFFITRRAFKYESLNPSGLNYSMSYVDLPAPNVITYVPYSQAETLMIENGRIGAIGSWPADYVNYKMPDYNKTFPNVFMRAK